MLSSIKLYNKPFLRTAKVNAAKLHTAKLPVTQALPQFTLCFSLVTT
jgi:hypothetical protein